MKYFDGTTKLSLGHFAKCLINICKFRLMLQKIYPNITGIIIYKDKEITILCLNMDGAGPQITEWIRSKGTEEVKSLLLNDKFVCFSKWQKTQLKDLKSTDPEWSWEIKSWTHCKEAWPKQECHKLEEVTEATREVYMWPAICRDISLKRSPTLRPVPRGWPIWWSYTTIPSLSKISLRHNSQNW